MPSVTENQALWGGTYDWSGAGDEWSARWGSTEMQWYGAIYPRIQAFLPVDTLLEVAPGFGRWTQYLKAHCRRLVLVDLSEKCIAACRERFRGDARLEYHVNDGKSLAGVDDDSVDFVFSFDSLVHVDLGVLRAYLGETARTLRKDGAGFIHHSNLGEHAGYHAFLRRIPRGKRTLDRLGLIDDVTPHWRDPGVTAAGFAAAAREAGLSCVGQEKVNWLCRRLIDCFSVIARPGSRWDRPNRVRENPGFMREATALARLAGLYGTSSFQP
ncbi:MAG: class I SAM-dependent methyltransferase [Acidobacteria bacterium]|nr:class I SAM-dependent methyltransferase [Acidobacteriota bacterium]